MDVKVTRVGQRQLKKIFGAFLNKPPDPKPTPVQDPQPFCNQTNHTVPCDTSNNVPAMPVGPNDELNAHTQSKNLSGNTSPSEPHSPGPAPHTLPISSFHAPEEFQFQSYMGDVVEYVDSELVNSQVTTPTDVSSDQSQTYPEAEPTSKPASSRRSSRRPKPGRRRSSSAEIVPEGDTTEQPVNSTSTTITTKTARGIKVESDAPAVDEYRWRKYGQKNIKDSPYPRHYYKCTIAGCEAKKIIDSFIEDGKVRIRTQYNGKHIHPPDTTRATISTQ